MLKSKVLAAAVIVPAFLLGADLKTSTYSAEDFSRVEIETFNGYITAKVSSEDEISVSYTLGTGGVSEELDKAISGLVNLAGELGSLDNLHVDVDEDKQDRVLRIKVEQEDNEEIGGCNVEVSLPSDIFLKLTTDNGWITLDGNKAGFDLTTLNGYVTMANTAGDAEFEVTNGNVTIDHEGNITGRSTNGDISGEIEMPDHNGVCDLTTVNNDIKVAVPSTVGAKVSLSTVHGTTEISGFDVNVKKIDDDVNSTIRDGSGTITLTTVNGDIELKELE